MPPWTIYKISALNADAPTNKTEAVRVEDVSSKKQYTNQRT